MAELNVIPEELSEEIVEEKIPADIRQLAASEYRKAFNKAFKRVRSQIKHGIEPELNPSHEGLRAKVKVYELTGYGHLVPKSILTKLADTEVV